MSTYEDDSGDVISALEQREREILKMHPFISKRRVRTINSKHTIQQSWYGNSIYHKKMIDKTGVVLEVHSSITAAVKVKLDDDTSRYGEARFWHYKDLEMEEVDDPKIEPVLFDPMQLVV